MEEARMLGLEEATWTGSVTGPQPSYRSSEPQPENPMPAPARKSSSIITHRASATIALPAMTLGYSNLLDPETFDPDKPKLTMNGHLTANGMAAMVKTIANKVYTHAALDKLLKECDDNNVPARNKNGEPKLKSPEDWLEGALKEPKEGFPIQLPFIKIGNNLHYFKTVDGERVQQTRVMIAWDGHNKKLNLKRLLLGRGSVVEPVVFPNLYFSKTAGFIAPSLKLVGVRVIELVQFKGGGSNAPTETSDEDIKNVMGRDIEAADLSAFMGEDADDDEDVAGPVRAPREDQSPQDRAAGMF